MPIGPSTTTASYLVAAEPNVRFTSIVTVGDALPGGGVFAGIPDGLGAFDNGNGTITVLVNHELRESAGIVRDHGSIGAFVDRLVIDKSTLAIVSADASVNQRKPNDDDDRDDRDDRDDNLQFGGSDDHQSPHHDFAFHGDYLLA